MSGLKKGFKNEVVRPSVCRYKSSAAVGRVITVLILGKHVSPELPFSPRVKVPHRDDVVSSIVSIVTLKIYDSAVNSNAVVTSGKVTITLVESVTVGVVVRAGKSTAVSTPLTVT